MRRKHLFEIEDLAWCPKILREVITDYLSGLYHLLDLFEPAYKKIVEIVNATKVNAIIDCCSGSGGPTPELRAYLDSQQLHSIPITLTDKFPNLELFDKFEKSYGTRLMGYKESIDASQFPVSLKGLRCFFSSFHHFTPNQAINILQDAANHNAPIAIFESTQRHLVDFIRAMMSPILMLIILPLTKKLNWRKFLITYVIPIAPLAFMWDYLVSNLRTYSVTEMQLLLQKVNAPNYQWEVGKLKSQKAKSDIIYLLGYPKNTSSPIS
jgi:hypothetical protein